MGPNPSKWRQDCGELVRSFTTIKVVAIEAGIQLNEARDLEVWLQYHLNQVNEMVDFAQKGLTAGLELMAKLGEAKNVEHKREDRRGGQGGPGGATGGGPPGRNNGPCFICGSVFHWAKSCPEKRPHT